MENNAASSFYRIWGADREPYGPVALPTLIEWINEERVTPDSWIYIEAKDQWRKASELSELTGLFASRHSPAEGEASGITVFGVKPGSLRRIKIFAEMDEAQLATFIRYMEVVKFKQFSQVVRLGDHGDSMYLVLEGELRARIMIDGKESTLATLGVGEFFGEIALLDEGPRSADVLANEDSLVLKITVDSFRRLMHEAPGLALRFLYAISRSISGRMRLLTKKYQDTIHFSRTLAS